MERMTGGVGVTCTHGKSVSRYPLQAQKLKRRRYCRMKNTARLLAGLIVYFIRYYRRLSVTHSLLPSM